MPGSANFESKKKLEFRKSDRDVLPGKTEGKSVKFISPAKGYFRETYKS